MGAGTVWIELDQAPAAGWQPRSQEKSAAGEIAAAPQPFAATRRKLANIRIYTCIFKHMYLASTD